MGETGFGKVQLGDEINGWQVSGEWDGRQEAIKASLVRQWWRQVKNQYE